MFSFDKGKEIAKIIGGENDGEILHLMEPNKNTNVRKKIDRILLDKNEHFEIIPDSNMSQVIYCAGARASGKTTFCLQYIKNYLKMNKGKDFYLFSRTNFEDDPAYKKLKLIPMQIELDEDLVDNPIDITKHIKNGCIIFFDDCHTVHNDKIRKEIDKLMKDIIEVGRKLKITIVISNHLIIPDERKIARCILNELTLLCVFPRSGSSQQIGYCLTKYFDYTKYQVEEFTKKNMDTRWVCFYKDYPKIVVSENQAIIPK
jgi:hypothetical protein